MSGKKFQRATQSGRRTRRMKVVGLIAIKAVTCRIDLNLNLRTLRGAQRTRMIERRDRIALTKVHQHRTARLFRNIRRDLSTVVTKRTRNPFDMAGAAPRNCAAPAITKRCDLSGPTDLLLRRLNIGGYLLP